MAKSVGGLTFSGMSVSHPTINGRHKHNIMVLIVSVPARSATWLNSFIEGIIFFKITIIFQQANRPHAPGQFRSHDETPAEGWGMGWVLGPLFHPPHSLRDVPSLAEGGD